MNKRHEDYNEYLRERLKDPELALAYLNEALNDEDQRIFLLALKRVLEAQDNDITALADEAELNRTNIYRMLSKKGNPRWDNLKSLIGALGLQIKLEARK